MLAGCLKPAARTCGALVCPNGTVCSPGADRCVTVAQLSACSAKAEKSACNAAGEPAAECLQGVCVSVLCGDGIVETGEVCDDGNTVSCDGCSGDCRSNETCGNAIVDCQEQCDDGSGNSDLPNALCRSDCKRQRCGDGIVDDKSGEDCEGVASSTASCSDFGFYTGTLSCSSACRSDTSSCAGFCGDGVLNGIEQCDGAPPGGESCLDFAYDTGNLRCAPLCTPSFVGCEHMGFQPTPLPASLGLFIDWIGGSGPDDVFAVGFAGQALHYDGHSWTQTTTGTSAEFFGVWSAGPGDTYASGTAHSIFHYDGHTWTSQDVSAATDGATVYSVWGASSGNVYAVDDFGEVLHLSGSSWSVDYTQTDEQTLFAIWGSGPGDIYAVGDVATVLHFDGGAWTQLPSTDFPAVLTGAADPTTWPSILDIWGSGPSDVFMAIDGGAILHFNGAWTQMDTTAANPNNNTLFSIWGSSATDVYASGSAGTLIHYDGVGWTAVKSGTNQSLSAVWSSGPDDVFSGGGAVIVHFAGGPTLSVVDPGTTDDLFTVWGAAEGDVYAAGEDGNSVGAIVHYDGSNWTVMDATGSAGTNNGPNVPGELSAIWGVRAGAIDDVFAAGDITGDGDPNAGNSTILHYNSVPGTWVSMTTPSPESFLQWIWGTAADNLYVSGNAGTILWYNGSTWVAQDSGTTDNKLRGIWGSGPNDIYVCGEGGLLLHSADGQTWQQVGQGITQSDFWGLWGNSATDVFAFADPDGIFHFDGTTWSKMTSNSNHAFDYASGGGVTDIFALEAAGSALNHYDGADWAPVASLNTPGVLWGDWVTRTYGYFVGVHGSIIHLDRHCTATENNCSDRWDNDCDGLLNCADPDCNADPHCTIGGDCQTLATLSCGATMAGNTTGAQPVLERYSCAARLDNGGERYYRFTAVATGSVTVALANLSADLDLVVLGTSASGGCDALGACLQGGQQRKLSETSHLRGDRRRHLLRHRRWLRRRQRKLRPHRELPMKTILFALCFAWNAFAFAAETPERPWANGVARDVNRTKPWRFSQRRQYALCRIATFRAERWRAIAEAPPQEWDHPLTARYNAAVSLINLDQPLAAYENIEVGGAELAGDAPLGAETYKQGLLYKKLLFGQIAELEVTCDDAGADVALDGELLFTAPGKVRRHLLPGAHQLVASRAKPHHSRARASLPRCRRGD